MSMYSYISSFIGDLSNRFYFCGESQLKYRIALIMADFFFFHSAITSVAVALAISRELMTSYGIFERGSDS